MPNLSTLVLLLLTTLCIGCSEGQSRLTSTVKPVEEAPKELKVAAEATDKYLSQLQGKKIAVVANRTSMIKDTHLVDSLLNLGVDVVKVFAPEHGFRGDHDAGEKVANEKDENLEIISLYGKNKKPKAEDLAGIDLVIFDIQDVGVRFYTYVSTLHYVMEACAENKVSLIVLDRPNPNAHYVDGPVLKSNQRSFVGMHPVPLVYGMTIGEYGKMINGEQWLENGVQCDLQVIPCENYTHDTEYELPLRPSPNLPTMGSIYLYPSLGLFEGTVVSVGRGTDFPFETWGHPSYTQQEFEFTPQPNFGAKYPKLEGEKCFGQDLRNLPIETVRRDSLNLGYLLEAYREVGKNHKFFLENGFFNKLAGTGFLKKQIEDGLSEQAIRDSWQTDLNIFLKKREKYLIY